jgi:hypothetical protein
MKPKSVQISLLISANGPSIALSEQSRLQQARDVPRVDTLNRVSAGKFIGSSTPQTSRSNWSTLQIAHENETVRRGVWSLRSGRTGRYLTILQAAP